MTNDCKDCAKAALIWHWGGYRADCEQCEIRALACSPAHIRKASYSSTPAAQLPLKKVRVAGEFSRIKALRLNEIGK